MPIDSTYKCRRRALFILPYVLISLASYLSAQTGAMINKPLDRKLAQSGILINVDPIYGSSKDTGNMAIKIVIDNLLDTPVFFAELRSVAYKGIFDIEVRGKGGKLMPMRDQGDQWLPLSTSMIEVDPSHNHIETVPIGQWYDLKSVTHIDVIVRTRIDGDNGIEIFSPPTTMVIP